MKTILLLIAFCLSSCQTIPPVIPVYGPSNPLPTSEKKFVSQRLAFMIELKPEKEQEYRKLHANVWPQVKETILKCNIRNYDIFIIEISGRKYLVSSFDYIGTDMTADFKKMGEDVVTRTQWWPLTDACQQRMEGAPKGEQWQKLEKIMHLD